MKRKTRYNGKSRGNAAFQQDLTPYTITNTGRVESVYKTRQPQVLRDLLPVTTRMEEGKQCKASHNAITRRSTRND